MLEALCHAFQASYSHPRRFQLLIRLLRRTPCCLVLRANCVYIALQLRSVVLGSSRRLCGTLLGEP